MQNFPTNPGGSTLATPLDDQLVENIVGEVVKILKTDSKNFPQNVGRITPIPLGVSNRHVHITPETFAKLFGAGSTLEEYRQLYQAGEFASKQAVTIVGRRMRAIQNVRILGPMRKYDQVELTLTDSIYLGIDAPYRNSGDLKDAAPLTLVGPQGSVYLEHCAIVANRHIHMSSKDAEAFGVSEGDYCKVRVAGVKSTVFENVLIRVNDAWKLQMHLDTDDANAAFIRGEINAEFIGKM